MTRKNLMSDSSRWRLSRIQFQAILFTMLMVISLPAMTVDLGAGGTVAAAEPIEISNVEELQAMEDDLSADYVLVDDIDATETETWNDGDGFIPVGEDENEFTGTLDGQGHTIDGLYINNESSDAAGLFGWTDGATVEDIVFTDAEIVNDGSAGVLSGIISDSTVRDLDIDGSVEGHGNTHGGISGDASDSELRDIYVDVDVESSDGNVGGAVSFYSGDIIDNVHASGDVKTGGDDAGGLVAYSSGDISNSSSTGTVESERVAGGFVASTGGTDPVIKDSWTSSDVTSQAVGGFGGYLQFGPIVKRSNSSGTVTVVETGESGTDRVGGFAAQITSNVRVEDSYSTSDIIVDVDGGASEAGGFAGSVTANDEGDGVHTSYSTGSIDGDADAFGGFIGDDDDGEAIVEYAYWDTEASGIDESPSGTGLTTDQMTGDDALEYMEGFDFDETWSISDSYPVYEAPGGTITGQVTDQNDEPVEDATVRAWGWHEPNFEEYYADELEEYDEIQDLIDEIEDELTNVEPDGLIEFADEYADDGDIDSVIDDLDADTIDADAFTDDVDDHHYLLVHENEDWGGLGVGVQQISDNVDDPRITVSGEQQVVFSIWDPSEEPGLLGGNQVDNSFYGGTKEGDVVVEQLSPTGEVTSRTTANTIPLYETGGLIGSGKEHHAVRMGLSDGVYRAYPDGHEQTPYYFIVGEPEDIFIDYIEDLEDEFGELTERAKQLEDLSVNTVYVNEKTTTDERGNYGITIDEAVGEVNVVAYKGGQGIVEDLAHVDSPEDVSIRDMKTHRNQGYNGTFYLPSEQIESEHPNEDVDLTMFRTDGMPFEDIDTLQDLLEYLMNEYLDGNISDLEEVFEEWFDADIDELNEVLEQFEDIDELEEFYEEYEQILDEDRFESALEDILEDEESIEDDNELQNIIDDIDDTYDGDGLDEDEVRSIIEEYLGDELTEDEIEELVEQLVGEVDREELLQKIEDLEEELEEIIEDINFGDIDGEIEDGLLSFTVNYPGSIEEAVVFLEYEDGTTETVDEEYISIESAGLFGGDRIVVDEYPIDEDRGLVDIRYYGYTEHGLGSGSDTIRNPAFDGNLADIDSIEFSTLAPGKDELVYADINTPPGSSFERLTDAQAYDPAGGELNTTVDDDRDRLRFRTDGEGVYTIRLTLESSTGDTHRLTEKVRAGETSRNDPPTIRVGTDVTGKYAVIGDGLDNARLEDDDGTLRVEAISDRRGDVPTEVHIQPGKALSGDRYEFDVAVLHGPDERSADQHIGVYVHYEGLDVNAINYVNGQPVTWDGSTRYGEMDERDDVDKQILVTYTDENGVAEITTIENPGRLDRLSHWVAVVMPDVPLLNALVPLLEFVVTLLLELATTVEAVATTPTQAAPQGVVA